MNTKIVVVQIKDIIKKSIFIVICAAVIIGIIAFLSSKTPKTAYIPGTYSSEIILTGSPVVIEVTVDKTSVTDIRMLNLSETQEVFYPLIAPSFETVREEVLSAQTTDIELTENTETSALLLSAVNAALTSAAID
ncbi:MAG: hypothetical protein LIO87_07900 [Eubacterium sp.]|nr:hypothetical protein [Eubacterium sp.]